jgi:hypothetical protein
LDLRAGLVTLRNEWAKIVLPISQCPRQGRKKQAKLRENARVFLMGAKWFNLSGNDVEKIFPVNSWHISKIYSK